MRPELTVPHAAQKAIDVLEGIEQASLPVVELHDLPEMPDMPSAPMFHELQAPEHFPAQAGVDFADLPMAHLPDIFDI